MDCIDGRGERVVVGVDVLTKLKALESLVDLAVAGVRKDDLFLGFGPAVVPWSVRVHVGCVVRVQVCRLHASSLVVTQAARRQGIPSSAGVGHGRHHDGSECRGQIAVQSSRS